MKYTQPKCVCGYQSDGAHDLDEHILAMMNVFDGQSHIEAR